MQKAWVGNAVSFAAPAILSRASFRAGLERVRCCKCERKEIMSYKASVTKKTLEVLKVLATAQRQLGVSEIARVLSINKSTAFGILGTLQEDGYVLKDLSTKKYTVGDELVNLSRMISEGKGLAHVARPFLERLAESVDETVFLGIGGDDTIKIIDVVEAKKSLTLSSPIGTKIPITAGAPGKAYLSSLQDHEVVALLKKKGLTAFTKTSITNIDRFLREIEATRKQGFALDREEYIKGVRGVATNVASGNRVAGVIWVAGFAGSMDRRKVLEVSRKISETARRLTEKLTSGHIPTAGEDGGHRARTSRQPFKRDFDLPVRSARVSLEQSR
jgi:IclR family KDG regulon transcriptional repressor